MKKSPVRIGLVAAALALAAPAASEAQIVVIDLPREYGIDGGLQFGLGDAGFTTLVVPAQTFRIGFFRSPQVSIEPFGSLTYTKPKNSDATTLVTAGTGLLYHLSVDRRSNQLYVRPFVGLDYISGDQGGTQFGAGAGLGIKLPWRPAFSWRLEANVGYVFESGDFDSGTTVGISAGLSFFDIMR